MIDLCQVTVVIMVTRYDCINASMEWSGNASLDGLPMHRLGMFGWHRPRSVSPGKGKNYDGDNDAYKNYNIHYTIDKDASDRKRCMDSIETKLMFTKEEIEAIEDKLDDVVQQGRDGKYKKFTMDKAPLRFIINHHQKVIIHLKIF